MKKKNLLFYFLFLLIGYIIGITFPLNDIFFSNQKIRFSEDFTIKAGTIAKQRHFQGSYLNTPIEIYFNKENSYPKLELVSEKNDK